MLFLQHNISIVSVLIVGISNELNLSCSGEEGKGTGCGSTDPTYVHLTLSIISMCVRAETNNQ